MIFGFLLMLIGTFSFLTGFALIDAATYTSQIVLGIFAVIVGTMIFAEGSEQVQKRK